MHRFLQNMQCFGECAVFQCMCSITAKHVLSATSLPNQSNHEKGLAIKKGWSDAQWLMRPKIIWWGHYLMRQRIQPIHAPSVSRKVIYWVVRYYLEISLMPCLLPPPPSWEEIRFPAQKPGARRAIQEAIGLYGSCILHSHLPCATF